VLRPRKILVILILVIASLTLQAQWGAAATSTLTSAEASRHTGEAATVCGAVASATYAARSRGGPTFLNLDKPYPQPHLHHRNLARTSRGFREPRDVLRRQASLCEWRDHGLPWATPNRGARSVSDQSVAVVHRPHRDVYPVPAREHPPNGVGEQLLRLGGRHRRSLHGAAVPQGAGLARDRLSAESQGRRRAVPVMRGTPVSSRGGRGARRVPTAAPLAKEPSSAARNLSPATPVHIR
jgi:hypothetical protein